MSTTNNSENKQEIPSQQKMPFQSNMYPQPQSDFQPIYPPNVPQQVPSVPSVPQTYPTQPVQPVQPIGGLPSSSPSDPDWIYPVPGMMEVSILALMNLFMPGLGTILLGQTKKGVTYVIEHMLLGFLAILLSYVLIGVLLYPILIVMYIFVLLDGLKIAERLKQGYPVMQGECYYSISTWFVSFFVTPVFVASNPAKCPQVWKDKMAQYTHQNNTQQKPAANL